MSVSYRPVLKSAHPALADGDPGFLKSTVCCIVQISNMTKQQGTGCKQGDEYFYSSVLVVAVKGGRSSGKPTDSSAPSSHLFTIHCNLPNN